jgi:hypothetical protein
MFLLAQRAFIALCLLSLIGCSISPCRQWEIQEISTRIPCFNGGRLILGPDSNYSHLELELNRSRAGIRFYINVLFLQAPPLPHDPNRTRAEILFEDQEPWVVYPYLMAGGQRLLLPGDVADVLVQTLLDGYSFTIRLGRNQIEVVPNRFSVLYARLLALKIEEDVPTESL